MTELNGPSFSQSLSPQKLIYTVQALFGGLMCFFAKRLVHFFALTTILIAVIS